MTRPCQLCETAVNERMLRFSRDRRIGGYEPLLRHAIVSETEALFPGAFELLLHPSRWTGDETIPGFPILASKVINVRFEFHVVQAPLPFAACCVRIPCTCGVSNRIAVVNSSFVVLTSHLVAASLDKGLRPGQLAKLTQALKHDPSSLVSFPAPHEVPRSEIFAGVAWLLFHEYGHVVGASSVKPESLPPPAVTRTLVANELDADLAAFHALHHRCLALPQHSKDQFATLLCGVELVLRAIAALSGPDGSPRKLEESNIEADYGHPSPKLRWLNIRCLSRQIFRLQLSNRESYRSRRKLLLHSFNGTILGMRSNRQC